MSTPTLYIEGPAFWAPTLPGWDIARAAFRGEGALVDPPSRRPAPQVLAPAERRRAPDAVAIALEVAAAAVAGAGRNAADLPCVFASAHGDLAINDYMSSTLVAHPTQLSPIKFHNSVHNAAVGYWTIGTGCMAASNSLTAFNNSFAAGLLEAATQCAADAQAVLLAGFDVQAVGALASVAKSDGMLAGALVLAPERTAHSVAAVDWTLLHAAHAAPALRSDAARSLAGNAMADALPLFEALARGVDASDGDGDPARAGDANVLVLPLSARLALQLTLRPLT